MPTRHYTPSGAYSYSTPPVPSTPAAPTQPRGPKPPVSAPTATSPSLTDQLSELFGEPGHSVKQVAEAFLRLGGEPQKAPQATADLAGSAVKALTHGVSTVEQEIGKVAKLPTEHVSSVLGRPTLGNPTIGQLLKATKHTPLFRTEGPGQYGAAYQHNAPYAKKGPYQTHLNPAEERAFRNWVAANGVPFNPNAKHVDYDMRGYWQATRGRGWHQGEHFPDTFKTPFDTTFSQESKYATRNNPFAWHGNTLVDQRTGQVVYGGSNRGVRVNRRGKITTPATRQAAQRLAGARQRLIASLRPDTSGLSAQERAILPYALQAHREYPDIPVSVLMAQDKQESNFNPLAVSGAGAFGTSQFIPGTAAAYGVHRGSSPAAIQSQETGQAHYLHDLGFAQDPQKALSGYSGGYAAGAYNNPILADARTNYAALDKPAVADPKARAAYQKAVQVAKSEGINPTPFNGDVGRSGAHTVFVRADAKGMVQWVASALGTQEGSERQAAWATRYGLGGSEPWCANFVSNGLARRGVPLPPNPNYVPSYEHEWSGGTNIGTDLTKAKPGDLITFSGQHIGVYVGNGEIVSGNYGNQVARSRISEESVPVSAILRPNYKGGKVAVSAGSPLPGSSSGSAFGTPGAAGGATAVPAALEQQEKAKARRMLAASTPPGQILGLNEASLQLPGFLSEGGLGEEGLAQLLRQLATKKVA